MVLRKMREIHLSASIYHRYDGLEIVSVALHLCVWSACSKHSTNGSWWQ